MNIPAGSMGILFLLIGASNVFADQFDTINYSASVGALYDDNVFRLPSRVDSQIAIGKPDKSDRIQQVSFAINLDKKYSNQEILLSANVTNNKYDTFSTLDYDATAYKAAWLWNLGSKLNGAWSVDRTQSLNNFEDVRTNTRNLRTLFSPRFNVDWWFQSNWHLLAGVSNEDSTSSTTTVNSPNYRTNKTEWGVKYTPGTGNSIVLLTRNIKGSYIDVSPDFVALLDTGYSENQNELQVNWQPTAKSRLSGNLVSIRRNYPVLSERDYSVVQKGISYAWGVTAKSNISLSLNNSVNPWFDASSSYYDTNTVMISSGWQISARTDMQVSLMRSSSDYRRPVVANAITRYDENQSQQIGLGWSPYQSARFSATYIYSQRTSNYREFEFTDNSTNLILRITF